MRRLGKCRACKSHDIITARYEFSSASGLARPRFRPRLFLQSTTLGLFLFVRFIRDASLPREQTRVHRHEFSSAAHSTARLGTSIIFLISLQEDSLFPTRVRPYHPSPQRQPIAPTTACARALFMNFHRRLTSRDTRSITSPSSVAIARVIHYGSRTKPETRALTSPGTRFRGLVRRNCRSELLIILRSARI